MSLNDTSGGIEIGAPPTRDCAGDVVEKHCVRDGEKAGARKMGSEPRWKDSLKSWRAQRWGNDMMARVFGCLLLGGLWILSPMILNEFSVHVTIYIPFDLAFSFQFTPSELHFLTIYEEFCRLMVYTSHVLLQSAAMQSFPSMTVFLLRTWHPN